MKILEGPFHVAHHSSNGSDQKVIQIPNVNDPVYPTNNISHLNAQNFGFKVPGSERSHDMCVVLLHVDWKSTYEQKPGIPKTIDNMWETCKNQQRSQVGESSFFCTANCLHLRNAEPIANSNAPTIIESKSNDSTSPVAIPVQAPPPNVNTIYIETMPLEVPLAFDHAVVLRLASDFKDMLLASLQETDTSNICQTASRYTKDLEDVHGEMQWGGVEVPIVSVNLSTIDEEGLCEALVTILNTPEANHPHALRQPVQIVDESSLAIDSGGLWSYASHCAASVIFNKTFGGRLVKYFIGLGKVGTNLFVMFV